MEDVPYLDEDSEDSFGFEIGINNAKKIGKLQDSDDSLDRGDSFEGGIPQ